MLLLLLLLVVPVLLLLLAVPWYLCSGHRQHNLHRHVPNAHTHATRRRCTRYIRVASDPRDAIACVNTCQARGIGRGSEDKGRGPSRRTSHWPIFAIGLFVLVQRCFAHNATRVLELEPCGFGCVRRRRGTASAPRCWWDSLARLTRTTPTLCLRGADDLTNVELTEGAGELVLPGLVWPTSRKETVAQCGSDINASICSTHPQWGSWFDKYCCSAARHSMAALFHYLQLPDQSTRRNTPPANPPWPPRQRQRRWCIAARLWHVFQAPFERGVGLTSACSQVTNAQ